MTSDVPGSARQRRRRRHRVLLLALTFATGVSAQVNTERMRGSLTDGTALSLDVSASLAVGNTEFVRVGVGGRADVARGPSRAFVVGRLDLSRAGGATFEDRAFAHVRYNRDLGGPLGGPSWLVAEAFAQVEQNQQQRLDARTLVGGGLRAELLDRDSVGFALGLTPMLEREALADDLGTDTVVRLSSYLAGRLTLGSGSTLTATVYGQPRADRVGDVRVLGQVALDVALTRALRLRLRADLRHDSRPPVGVERTDLRIEQGVVVVLRQGNP